jgi:F-type H+-transporting ATPase subunit b
MSFFRNAACLRRLMVFSLVAVLFAGVSYVQAHAAGVVLQAPSDAGVKSTPTEAVPQKNEQVKDENEEFRQSPTVKKMGAMIGLKPTQAAAAFTIFNFLVLVIALAYGLLKALPKAFRNRSSAIQKNLVDARTATEEATARLNSVESRLAKLDEQIAAMSAQAEAESVRDEQRIKESVEAEKVKIIAAAEAEIQNASTLARRGIQKYAAELAIEQAARKLVVSAETDKLLVESFAHRLFDEKGSAN